MRICVLFESLTEETVLRQISKYGTESGHQVTMMVIMPDTIEQVRTEISEHIPDCFLISRATPDIRKITSEHKRPVFCVDHGTSFLKCFITKDCQQPNYKFLLSNDMLRMLYSLGCPENASHFYNVGYCGSPLLLSPPFKTREQFCKDHGLDSSKPIILYAPTWIDDEQMAKSKKDYDNIVSHLKELGNFITVQHPDGLKLEHNTPNDGLNIFDAVKHSAVVISDNSSIMFEAASLGKRIIQVVLTSYTENVSTNYMLPCIPLVNLPFPFGWLTRPYHLKSAVEAALTNYIYSPEFDYLPKLGSLCGVSANSIDNTIKVMEHQVAGKKVDEIMVPTKFQVSALFCTWFLLPKTMKQQNDKIVITFGTYDLFHLGHLRILSRAKELGTKLIVGVSSDALNFRKKNKYPINTQDERVEMVRHLDFVDEVFVENALELKRHYIIKYQADILVMGDDWAGRMDEYSDLCQVIYFPRTPGISTTELLERMKKQLNM